MTRKVTITRNFASLSQNCSALLTILGTAHFGSSPTVGLNKKSLYQKSTSFYSTPEWVDENGEGRCTVGIWFKPLQDDVAHSIRKFKSSGRFEGDIFKDEVCTF